MLPLFPVFKKLEISDRQDIDLFTHPYLPYSDFNFISMWSYNTENDIQISNLHNNLVIKMRHYITNAPFYSFIGTNRVLETCLYLLKAAKKENILQSLYLVPEVDIHDNILNSKDIVIQEDPNNYDYILSIDEIFHLKERKYYNKRKLLNTFDKRYPECTARVFSLEDSKHQQKIIDLFFLWAEKKGKKREETEHELHALQRLIRDIKYFSVLPIGIFHSEELIGFLLAEVLKEGYGIGHFTKANLSYKGIYEKLYVTTARELKAKGCRFFNIEQDLGMPGARLSKTQWNPIHFLKKYTISLI